MPYEEQLDRDSAAGCSLLVFLALASLGVMLGSIACGIAFGAPFGLAAFGVYLCLVALFFLGAARKSKGR